MHDCCNVSLGCCGARAPLQRFDGSLERGAEARNSLCHFGAHVGRLATIERRSLMGEECRESKGQLWRVRPGFRSVTHRGVRHAVARPPQARRERAPSIDIFFVAKAPRRNADCGS